MCSTKRVMWGVRVSCVYSTVYAVTCTQFGYTVVLETGARVPRSENTHQEYRLLTTAFVFGSVYFIHTAPDS